VFELFWADDDALPAMDRGLAYGDGLFETILINGDGAPLLGYHLDRMIADARRLAISVHRGELEKACSQALRRYTGQYGGQRWVLKLVLTRGVGGRGYRPLSDLRPNLLISHSPAAVRPSPGGVLVDFSRVPLVINPLLSGIKSLNRLEQVMASRELTGDLFEVLMSNPEGHVLEGTRTNLFVRSCGTWLTPPLPSLAVAGVMRRFVLERLVAEGQPVREQALEVGSLMGGQCEGVWLSNSVLGVIPVRNLAGQDLPVDEQLATIIASPAILD